MMIKYYKIPAAIFLIIICIYSCKKGDNSINSKECEGMVGFEFSRADSKKVQDMQVLPAIVRIKNGKIDWSDSYFMRQVRYWGLEINIEKDDSTVVVYDGWGGKVFIQNRLVKENRFLFISPGKNKELYFNVALKVPIDSYINMLEDCFASRDMQKDILHEKTNQLNKIVDDDIIGFAVPAAKEDQENMVYGYFNQAKYYVRSYPEGCKDKEGKN